MYERLSTICAGIARHCRGGQKRIVRWATITHYQQVFIVMIRLGSYHQRCYIYVFLKAVGQLLMQEQTTKQTTPSWDKTWNSMKAKEAIDKQQTKDPAQKKPILWALATRKRRGEVVWSVGSGRRGMPSVLVSVLLSVTTNPPLTFILSTSGGQHLVVSVCFIYISSS